MLYVKRGFQMEQEISSIRAKKTTKERIKKFGSMGESENDVIERALDALEKTQEQTITEHCKQNPKECALSIHNEIKRLTKDMKDKDHKHTLTTAIKESWFEELDEPTIKKIKKHLKELTMENKD